MTTMTFQGRIYFVLGLLIVLSYAHPSFAQEPNFSMYHYTHFLTNPGSIGVQEDARVFVNYRNQSVSAGDNFQTSMLSGYYPVYIGNHRLGIGGTFISDKSSDFLKANGGMLALAYSVQLFPGSELSMGFQGGYFQRNIDFDFTTDNQFVDGTFNPDAATGEPMVNNSKGYLTASTGLYWQLKDDTGKLRGFAGASIFNFNQPNMSFIDEGTDKLPLSWKGTAGWRVYQHMKFSVMPTLRWVHQADNNFVNAGSWFRYEMNQESAQEIGVGLWYNTNKAGVISLEYNQDNLTLAGSYDLPISSELNTAQQTGIFEIALSLRLKKKSRPVPAAITEVEETTSIAPKAGENTETLPSQPVEPVKEPAAPHKEKPQTIDRLGGRKLSDSPSDLQPKQRAMQLAEKDKLTLERTVKFEFQTSDLTPESKKFLDEIAGIMKSNEWLKVELVGHTCNVGTEEVNENLSVERGKEVQGYLVTQGIDPARFIVGGKGEQQPVADNSTAEGRMMNRRVEFRVIEE